MNYKVIAVAGILGFFLPTIITTTINIPVITGAAYAQREFDYPRGTFTDREWRVRLSYNDDGYNYRARNLNNGSSIALSHAATSGDNQRQIYTWRNGEDLYQVVWRPNDPNTIRLKVFSPNGSEILDRLLYNSDD